MNRTPLLFCLLAVGCSADGPGAPDPKKGGPAPPATPKVSLMIFVYDRPGPGAVGRQTETFDDPTPELIEKRTRELRWDDPKQVPQVNLGWPPNQGPFTAFSVTGLLGAANEEHAVRANWVGVENGKSALRRSKPLKSLDEVVKLLLLAHGRDEAQLKAAQEWGTITPK